MTGGADPPDRDASGTRQVSHLQMYCIVTPFAVGVGGTFTSIWDLPEGNAGTTLTSDLPGI